MNEKNAQTNITSDVAPLGLNRREAVKRGALLGGAVGAAWTAPMVYDSFSTQAAAAGTSLFDNGTPDTYTGITIPAGRSATFVVTGGGGGGGSFQGLNGGSGTKISGTIGSGSSRSLTVVVASGGKGGNPYVRNTSFKQGELEAPGTALAAEAAHVPTPAGVEEEAAAQALSPSARLSP